MTGKRVVAGGCAVALLAIGVALTVVFLRADDDARETAAEIEPPTAQASPTLAPTEPAPLRGNSSKQPLWDIRLDAASPRRFDVDPLDVRLVELRPTTFDGCLGVRTAREACTAQAVSGYIAIFDVGGKQATYHVGDYQWVGPLDPGKGQLIDDGRFLDGVPPMDLNGILADYARRELALRLKVDLASVVTIHIIPTTFFDRCLGFSEPPPGSGVVCGVDLGERIPGDFVGLQAAGTQYDYNVSPRGVVWIDFSRGTGTQQPSMNVGDVQQLMREDLARRRGTSVEAVTIVSYRAVTWRDGCLGASKPGDVCGGAPVRGFLARLQAGGEDEEYHGAGMSFVDAWAGGLNLSQPTFDP